jgi:hypothetical protein
MLRRRARFTPTFSDSLPAEECAHPSSVLASPSVPAPRFSCEWRRKFACEMLMASRRTLAQTVEPCWFERYAV